MSKKSKKSKGGKSTMVWALVLILIISNAATVYYFMIYNPGQVPAGYVPESEVPMGIAQVANSPGDYIGETITLFGYLVYAAGNYLLVANPLFYFNNSLAYDNHINLGSVVPTGMSDSVGKQITVTGVLEALDPVGDSSSFVVDSFFDVYTELTVEGQYLDVQLDPYLEFSDIPYLFDATAEKYAVLYSGGIKPGKDYYRYWNDIIYMYFILQMHGYDSENIYVIYKDGVGEDTYTPVDYPATHTSLDTVFNALSAEMGRADTLFFYTTNHGGSGGISVWGP
ncbi:MAG: hypothetical protein ACW98Y_15035, partial [Candidatus Thorarchaeota archaeon]